MTKPVDQAREFWDAGHRVMGIHAIKNGECSCDREDCPTAGKHPIVSRWQATPHWSEEQFDTMADDLGHFETGYGVLCAGLLVIDVDARNGGVASLERLLADVPEIAGAGLIVETGSGGGSRHYYFTVPDGVALMGKHDDYEGIDFKSSGFVIGPGSHHASGGVYVASVGTPEDIEPCPDALIDILRKPERHRVEWEGRSLDMASDDLVGMLDHIDPDCEYDQWIRCGMAVHKATDGAGFDVWDDWSQRGQKYDANKMHTHWNSFGNSSGAPISIGTLIHYAEQGGWKMPVQFGPDPEFELQEEPTNNRDGLPCDITGVDLKRPPGFVGDLAAWIEARNRRPRENLSVAAALVAVGNIGGLNYTCDYSGVTTNLFAFCVAGSRTGKEAVQQSVAHIHRAAGMSIATHGGIKSEQEIVRNLLRSQASHYVVDEIGIFLKKVKNASDKGGASYLEGVIGMLMAAYSKADGYMQLNGDLRDDVRKELMRIATQLESKIDKHEATIGDEARLKKTLEKIAGLDGGLEKPFLSLIGFTTPVTFDELVDFDTATNGFIGRALIFDEQDTAPRSKRPFKAPDMPLGIEMQVKALASGGRADALSGDFENYGPRIKIPTTTDAAELLDDIDDWMWEQARDQSNSEGGGIEALYLGALELVIKISLILAISDGVRNADHVRWAFALIKRDVEGKVMRVIANDDAKSAPVRALAARIRSLIGDEGTTEGKLLNQLRKYKRDDALKMLASLVEAGKLRVEETEHRGNGAKIRRYFTAA